MGLGLLGAPRLDLYTSRSIPWVGAPVTYQAVVQGTAKGSQWALEVQARGPGGPRVVSRGKARADATGTPSQPRICWKLSPSTTLAGTTLPPRPVGRRAG